MSLLFSWKRKGVSIVCSSVFTTLILEWWRWIKRLTPAEGWHTGLFYLPDGGCLLCGEEPGSWSLSAKGARDQSIMSTWDLDGEGWHLCQKCAIQWESNFKRKSDTSTEVTQGVPGWGGIWELDRQTPGDGGVGRGIWTTLTLSQFREKMENNGVRRCQSKWTVNLEI